LLFTERFINLIIKILNNKNMQALKSFLKKPWVIVAIVLIVVVVVYLFATSGKKSPYEFAEARLGDVSQEVSVTGKVNPAESVDLAFEKSGKVASIAVSVGDKVAAGQVLANLTNSDLAAQLAQAQASLDKEVINLAELKAGTRSEELQIAQTSVSNAEKTLTDAQNNLANVRNKAAVDLDNYYEDVRDILNDAYLKADDAVNKQADELFSNDNSDNPELTFYTGTQAELDAESNRKKARLELTQFKQELDSLSASQSAKDLALVNGENHLRVISDFLNSASVAVNEAINLSSANQTNYKYYINAGRTNVNAAQTSISAQKQYIATQKATNQSNLTTAETTVNTAQSTLATAKDQLALKTAGSTSEQIAAQEAQIKYARANVQNYQAALSKTVIVSPLNGIITKKDAKTGEIVAANANVISVLSIAKFEIEANVSENEIAKVSIGDPVSMTLDALGPNEKFVGRIIKIDPAETIVSGVIYYKVTSVFDNEDVKIKSGMTVNLDIQTDKKENVLILPYYVVKGSNGDKYVRVLEDGKEKEKIVKTGLEGETMIEIVEGLKEGEKVIASN